MIGRRTLARLFQGHHGPSKIQVRHLNLLEYQSHKLLRDFNIPVPDGRVVTSAEEARDVVSDISAPSVLKAQVLAGGRGKGKYDSDGKGGVRIVTWPSEAYDNASQMLGYYLTTKQTPPGGLLVKKLYIYKAVDVADEFYLALTFDRDRGMPVLLISDVGGTNIESNIDKLQKFWFHLPTGLTTEIISYIQAQLGFSDKEMIVVNKILHQMIKLFREKDATLLELNPLVRTYDGKFICLDAKFSFDNAARFRQQELFSLEERSPEEEVEYQASKLGLSYVRLDGDIGNIVNGAGLAMATNDLISLYGGNKAFEILNNDSRIKGILVNIYGGIVRCDMIAESIVAAAEATGGFKVPVVVRLQGTNCQQALQLIEHSGLDNVIVDADFEAAAQMIVEQVGRMK
ncbi:Succinate--CoA ligase subunit beta [Penicillium maclennaniae]|uniref:Succinate--CoA ligase subunit beta n=1 Tax=Penicillium maclennaniae TaxID=1343394 RepID=UPI0025423932|nr:Succinate--CoA ligase subunit beta [Penicillium maclennaniae]KAJ5677897.1 Succinate--CoA ligase subunit beta [Penicillium maclennaniae]